jgi:regulator of sigma E protease
MEILVKVVQLVASLSLLIVLHELGHFLPARWFRTRVEKFYLFFDPWFSVVKKKIGDTEYGIGWLPLGGYVKISGMIDESMDKEQMQGPPQPWEFRSKPAWQRLIIMLGGVTVNFALGFFIFGMMLFTWGEEYLPAERATYGIATSPIAREMGLEDGDHLLRIGDLPFDKFNDALVVREILIHNAATLTVRRDGREVTLPVPADMASKLATHAKTKEPVFQARMPFTVGRLMPDMPAAAAGLQELDVIVSANEVPTPFFTDFLRFATAHPDQPIQVGILRDGAPLTLELTTTPEGRIGVFPLGMDHYFQFERHKYTLFQALPAGVAKGWQFLTTQLKAFGQMFSGRIKASDSLGGFISIGDMFPSYWSWYEFWNMTAILSLILAFMNLLPIPALDGGHVMFLLWEAATGRKVSDKVMEYATIAGFILVIGLVLYANGLDVLRLFGK